MVKEVHSVRRKWRKIAGLVTALLVLTTLLAACGGDDKPIPTPNKELAKDRLLYLGNQDGWPDLYTADLTGKFSGRITESPEAEFDASWSPDGSHIVFTALSGDQAAGDYSKNRQVVIIDADGKNRQVIATDAFKPRWSPDGTKILYLRTNPDTASPNPTSANPTLTPDPSSFGRFVRPPGTNPNNDQKLKSALYVAPATGDNKTGGIIVVDNAVYGVWSPDGKRVAYIGGNTALDKPRSLNLVNADGTTPLNISQRAKLTDQDALFVSWSPDGANLAFTTLDTNRDKVVLWKIGPEGNVARKLTEYQGSGRSLQSLIWAYADYYNPAPRLRPDPVWSPNSRYLSFADGSNRLSVIESDTGNGKTFPIGSAALGQDQDSVLTVSWLPDSRRLAYDRAAIGRNALISQANNYVFDWFDENLEVLDTLNKNVSTLSKPGGSFFLPTCCGTDALGAGSPDVTTQAGITATPKPLTTAPSYNGTLLEGKLVTVGGIGLRNLTVHDLQSGQSITISSGVFRGLDFSLSPQNDRLVYLEVGDQYNASLYVVDMDGKNRRKLSEGTGEPDDLNIAVKWSANGRQLAFQALGGDANLKAGLYTVALNPGETDKPSPRLITPANVSGFEWSPDGRTLAYRLDQNQYSIYLVDVDTPDLNNRLLASVGIVNRNYSSLGKGLLWSPNGKYLAISGPTSYSRFAVWLVTMDGKFREVPSSIVGKLISWSADSSKLVAATANYSQSTDVQVLNANTSTWRPYGPGAGPQIDSTGQFLAVFSRYDVGRFGNNLSANLQRLTLINLGTNGSQTDYELNFPPYYSYRARFYDWSPSSKVLAFYENNTIWAIGQDMKNPKALARAIGVERVAWAGNPNVKS